MTEPTNEELAEALRSIEGLPLGTRLIVRLAADRLSPPVAVSGCNDEWIEWEGGGRPVPSDTVVEVRYRDGKNGVPHRIPNKARADEYYWGVSGWGSDIIAYRVVGAP